MPLPDIRLDGEEFGAVVWTMPEEAQKELLDLTEAERTTRLKSVKSILEMQLKLITVTAMSSQQELNILLEGAKDTLLKLDEFAQAQG